MVWLKSTFTCAPKPYELHFAIFSFSANLKDQRLEALRRHTVRNMAMHRKW